MTYREMRANGYATKRQVSPITLKRLYSSTIKENTMLKFFTTLTLIISSSASASVFKKISYKCNGNIKAFVGAHEVKNQKKFKFELRGINKSYSLKLGDNSMKPDFEIFPLSKNQIRIYMGPNIVQMKTIESINFYFKDSQLLSPNRYRNQNSVVVKRTDASMHFSSRGQFEYLHSNLDDGFTAIAHDGYFEFQTSANKKMKCKINID
jgi:hypothetical protein